MSSRSLKPSLQGFGLLVLAGLFLLFVLLLVAARQPFSLLSKAMILLSSYRRLLPYIIAQAKHETADFTSTVFKRENNLFGMKHASIRKQVGRVGEVAPDGGNYQHYLSPVQSVYDYLLYLSSMKFPTAVADLNGFVSELVKRGYFGRNPSQSAIDIYYGGLKRRL